MKWTRNRPTTTGWWWYVSVHSDMTFSYMVAIGAVAGKLVVYEVGEEGYAPLHNYREDSDIYWATEPMLEPAFSLEDVV